MGKIISINQLDLIKNNRSIVLVGGCFDIFHIGHHYFLQNAKKAGKISFNLALPEKAIVDFFYLNRNILNGELTQFQGYRFSQDFKYDKKKLLAFAKVFQNKKVLLLTHNFIRHYAS